MFTIMFDYDSSPFVSDTDSDRIYHDGGSLNRHYMDWKSFFHLVYSVRTSVGDVGDIDDLEWKGYSYNNIQHLKLESLSIRLLEGVDLRSSTDRGRLILEYAVRTGSRALVAAVLERGVDVNDADEQGRTALHFATMLYDQDYYYLERKNIVHLISEDKYQSDAVEFFSRYSKTFKNFYGKDREKYDVLTLLLASGANVNARDDAGWTALHFAARFCNKKAVDTLLDHGADTNLNTVSNQTLLHLASMHKNPLHIEDSIFNQGFVACKGQNNSAEDCTTDCCSSAKLIDVNAQDDLGNTALHYLILYHEIRMKKFASLTKSLLILFIKYGSDIRLKNHHHETATQLLTRKIENTRLKDKFRNIYNTDTRVDCLYLLLSETLQNDRDTNRQCFDCFKNFTKTHNWDSLICFAFENGNESMINILLQYGREFGLRGNDGRTVLHVATEMGNVEVAELLLYSGLILATSGFLEIDGNITKFCNYVNAEYKNYGGSGTAMHIAVRKGHTEILQLILGIARSVDEFNKTDQVNLKPDDTGTNKTTAGSKIDLNILDCYGIAPLHIAVRMGDVDAIKLLLIHGADIKANIADRQGLTVLHLALKYERNRIKHSVAALRLNRNLTFVNPSQDVARQRTDHNDKENPDSTFSCMVQLLLEHGADINSRSSNEETVLHMAMKMSLTRHIDLSDTSSSDSEEYEYIYDDSPNTYLAQEMIQTNDSEEYEHIYYDSPDTSLNHQEMKYDIVKTLLVDSADIYNIDDQHGNSVVKCALALGYVEIFKMMVRYRKDVNLSDKEGHTVLMMMVNSKLEREVIQEELQLGAEVTKRDKIGLTALHYAQTGYAVDLLLNNGADVNAQSNRGSTPLHCALKRKCDPDCLDASFI